MAAIIAWRFLGKAVKAAEKTTGIMAPPMKPWAARQTIISPIEVEPAQSTLNSVKPAAQMAKR